MLSRLELKGDRWRIKLGTRSTLRRNEQNVRGRMESKTNWLRDIAQAAKLLADSLGRNERDLRSEELQLIRASGLFDENWYRERVPAVKEQHLDPIEHYLLIGDKIGQRPHPLFDLQYYRAQCPDSISSGYSALGHFLKVGGRLMLSPTPLFDVKWYVAENAEVDLPNGIAAFHHFLVDGGPAGRSPSPFFDSEAYFNALPNLRADNVNPLTHFVEVGAKDGKFPHWLFDTSWYIKTNPDCLQNGRDPLSHFLVSGGIEARNPHPLFSIEWYRSKAGISADEATNPLLHYLTVGSKQGIAPHPCFDVEWYTSVYSDVKAEAQDPFQHFVKVGASKGYFPNSHFDPNWYVAKNPIVAATGQNPLGHYLGSQTESRRRPSISFDPDWYERKNPESLAFPGGSFGHFLQQRKTAWIQGDEQQRRRWHGTLDMDVYNASETRLENYRYSMGDVIHDVLAAEATKNDSHLYSSYLGMLIGRGAKSILPHVAKNEWPKVSVIIPVYNGIHFTLACLESIAQCPPKVSIEVIVADNQSDDRTAELLKGRDDIRYVRNPVNLGFLRSCNRAASLARGEYVFLLNNDTIVCPGWLDELVATFDSLPNVGLAGSRLLFADGSLQEAGGIIWRDGSAWNFGRGGDPGHPAYSYLRSVDYISGCAIMVPKKIWDQVGGFDELFVPSYCEDSDLALRLRRGGFSVIYQPLSTVVHFEGMTQGRDETKGVKAYQTINTVKLRTRWADYLGSLQESGQNVDRAKDRGLHRRVLVLDNTTPETDKDAGSVTAFNLMLLFRDSGFAVTFIPQDNFLYLPKYTANLQRNGIEVIYGHYCSSVEQHLREVGDRYDVAVLFRPDSWERHHQTVRQLAPRAKLIYHTCDLHFLRNEREAELRQDSALRDLANRYKAIEIEALSSSDLAIVHSVAEAEVVASLVPDAQVAVFPWAIPVPGTDVGFELREHIAFVGGYQHLPNVDAVVHFVRDILPLIRLEIPNVKFLVVGSNPPQVLQDLAGPAVEVTGYVPDLASVLKKVRISVAPLRFGAGIKGKIATAMSIGLPTVATTIAAEGMGLSHDEDVLIADAPADFAAQVVRAYRDRALWEKLSRQGIAFARSTYGPMAAWRIFANILDRLALAPEGALQVPRLMSASDGQIAREPNLAIFEPITSLRDQRSYETFRQSYAYRRTAMQDKHWVDSVRQRRGTAVAFSIPAEQFVVLNSYADSDRAEFSTEESHDPDDVLICPVTYLLGGSRLMASMMKGKAVGGSPLIFLNEDVSALYAWGEGQFGSRQIVTPWKLDDRYAAGSFDIVATVDNLDRYPEPGVTLREFARILRKGGQFLAVLNLDLDRAESTSLTDLTGEGRRAAAGMHVRGAGRGYSKFGWDLLSTAQASGFSEARLELFHSFDYGFGGRLYTALRCVK